MAVQSEFLVWRNPPIPLELWSSIFQAFYQIVPFYLQPSLQWSGLALVSALSIHSLHFDDSVLVMELLNENDFL
jgi:hypothetical protein